MTATVEGEDCCFDDDCSWIDGCTFGLIKVEFVILHSAQYNGSRFGFNFFATTSKIAIPRIAQNTPKITSII